MIKFSCEKVFLQNAIAVTSRAVAQKSSIPALEGLGDTTRLIVAQRIGTIRDADKIIVLDEGRIAGMGTHDELMKNCEVYRQIAFSQLSKEELA